MQITDTILSATKGASAVVALVTILPISGPVGVISAAAAAPSSIIGAAIGLVDHFLDDN